MLRGMIILVQGEHEPATESVAFDVVDFVCYRLRIVIRHIATGIRKPGLVRQTVVDLAGWI